MGSYTDITGSDLIVDLQYPDTNQNMVTMPLPSSLLPTTAQQILSTPLSRQFDTLWSGKPDQSGRTAHDVAVASVVDGIVNNGGYNVSVTLPTSGSLLASADRGLSLQYVLAGASAEWTQSTDSVFGSWADPTFKGTADIVVEMDSPIPAMPCSFDFTTSVSTENVDPAGGNFIGDVAVFVLRLFDGLFGLNAGQMPFGNVGGSGLDPSSLPDMMSSLEEGCQAAQSFGFTQFSVSVDQGQKALVFMLIHPVDSAPTVELGSTGGGGGLLLLPPPPVVSTAPTQVRPDSASTVTGAGYPVPATVSLALTFDDTTSGDVVSSDLQWGPSPGGPFLTISKTREPYDGADFFTVSNLTPDTGYQFRVRNHDELTVTPWSTWAILTTPSATAGQILLWLDDDFNHPLATAQVGVDGTFAEPVTIPSSTTAGTHRIYAQLMGGGVPAEWAQIEVLAPGSKYTPMVILTQTPPIYLGYEIPVRIEGFDAGTVNLALDSTAGQPLGTVTVATDDESVTTTLAPPPFGYHQVVAWEHDNGQLVQAAPLAIDVVAPQ